MSSLSFTNILFELSKYKRSHACAGWFVLPIIDSDGPKKLQRSAQNKPTWEPLVMLQPRRKCVRVPCVPKGQRGASTYSLPNTNLLWGYLLRMCLHHNSTGRTIDIADLIKVSTLVSISLQHRGQGCCECSKIPDTVYVYKSKYVSAMEPPATRMEHLTMATNSITTMMSVWFQRPMLSKNNTR